MRVFLVAVVFWYSTRNALLFHLLEPFGLQLSALFLLLNGLEVKSPAGKAAFT